MFYFTPPAFKTFEIRKRISILFIRRCVVHFDFDFDHIHGTALGGPIIFTYYAEIELSTSTIEYTGPPWAQKKWALFVLALYEAAGIRHNGLYSVNCVCIASRKHHGFRFPTSFYDRILLRFFYTIHSISVLGKEAKSWFYIIVSEQLTALYS